MIVINFVMTLYIINLNRRIKNELIRKICKYNIFIHVNIVTMSSDLHIFY